MRIREGRASRWQSQVASKQQPMSLGGGSVSGVSYVSTRVGEEGEDKDLEGAKEEKTTTLAVPLHASWPQMHDTFERQ